MTPAQVARITAMWATLVPYQVGWSTDSPSKPAQGDDRLRALASVPVVLASACQKGYITEETRSLWYRTLQATFLKYPATSDRAKALHLNRIRQAVWN